MRIFKHLCRLFNPTPQRIRSRTYIARKKPVELYALRVRQEQVIDTWEGTRTAFVGDYLMTGIQGEHWPVPGDKFEELYDIIEQKTDDTLKVRKRIMEVPVCQIYHDLTFSGNGEDFNAHTGDFIIAYSDGSCYPCVPDVFFETFEIIRPATPAEEPDFPQ
jgi:hypothetical protein